MKAGKGKLVTTIPLDGQQMRVLRQSFRSIPNNERLVELLGLIMEGAEEKREEVWNSVAKLAGFASMEEVEDAFRTLHIDWVTKNIEVREYPPEA